MPACPPGVRVVREQSLGEFPLLRQPEWTAAFPWLVQGTTGRGADGLDMGLFGHTPTGLAQARWRLLREVTGMEAALHARQVHGAAVVWQDQLPAGLTIVEQRDGHATSARGMLLTVSVADCVPVFLVSTHPLAICLLHAGWRGTAAGVLEAGVELLRQRAASRPEQLHLHAGPAICGNCYEVGPEVMAALQLPAPAGRCLLDLRALIASRALAAGIPASNITLSGHCTRHGDVGFWSHRGGCRERQVGVLGIRS
jgi:YfiH family protein